MNSIEVIVVTAVVFSLSVTEPVAPPKNEVIAAGTSVTVTAIAWVSVRVPSLALTITS